MTKRVASICAGVLMTLSLGCVLTTAGCNVIGFAAYTLFPPKVEAKYEPPKTPLLVIVENRANPGMLVAEADQLTGFIQDELITYEVAPLVSRAKLEKLRDTRSDIDKMTISQIGRETGAEQVLYVDLQKIQVGGIEGVPAHGRVEGRVHMVDVATGRMTFPTFGEAGYPISMETSIAQDISVQDLVLIRERMLRQLGTSIGRMFHEYNPEG